MTKTSWNRRTSFICDCSNRAFKIYAGYPVCERCYKIEIQVYAGSNRAFKIAENKRNKLKQNI